MEGTSFDVFLLIVIKLNNKENPSTSTLNVALHS